MAQIRDKNGRFVKNHSNGKVGLNRVERETVFNALRTRSALLHKLLLDTRRSIDDECGYPTTENIDIDKYWSLYEREPIGKRVVEVLPQESWKVRPRVYEVEDLETETEFEAALNELGRYLYGGSKYESMEDNRLWEYLERADKLSGIGHYGAILLGIDDGRDLSEPADFGTVGQRSLLFVRAFDERLCEIASYDRDETSARYGQPNTYRIDLLDDYQPSRVLESSSRLQFSSKVVHWTRVVHLADGLDSSEIIGTPRLRPVFNRVMDLNKLYGGSAEMYWRGAFPGIAVSTQPELVGRTEIDTSGIRDAIEQYQNTLQRYIALTGFDVKTLEPQVVDPASHIESQIEAICIVLGIPKRVFMGSERGELASSQDSKTWEGRLQRRRNGYVTPRIIVPVIDRLIALGILPEPEQYYVDWAEEDTQTPTEKAQQLVARTDAMVKYVQGNVGDAFMAPRDYLVREMGYEGDEADEILDAMEEYMVDHQEQLAEQELEMVGQQPQPQDSTTFGEPTDAPTEVPVQG